MGKWVNTNADIKNWHTKLDIDAEEMPQQLRVCDALPEDLTLIPNTTSVAHNCL